MRIPNWRARATRPAAVSSLSVVLVVLAVVAQGVATRTGATERDTASEGEVEAEIAGWPRSKQLAFLLFALATGVTVILLGIWSRSWGTD